MAGSGNTSLRTGLAKGLRNGAGSEGECPKIMTGYGTPSDVVARGTVYVKLDATLGTSSHYVYGATTTADWRSLSFK